MANAVGFKKEEEKPAIPHEVQRALELQEKLKKKMEGLIREFQTSYTNKNHIERLLRNDSPICINVLDEYTFASSLKIEIPEKIAKKLLNEEYNRLTAQVEEYEQKLSELICVIEELFGAED